MGTVSVLGGNGQAGSINERTLQQVLNPLDASVTLTRTTSLVLMQALSHLKLKKSHETELSTSILVLMVMLIGQHLSDGPSSSEGDDDREEFSTLYRLGKSLYGDYSRQLDTLIGGYFKSLPMPSFELAVVDATGVRLGPGLTRCLTELGFDELPISIDRLVRCILNDPGTGIAKRLAEPRNEALKALLVSIFTPVGGASSSVVRDAAPSELVLRVRDYAEALASVFREAQGDFAFALFGPWGSGKTTLAGEVKLKLEASEPRGPSARSTYQVVFHNAWKYPARPESWIFAYRSLIERASGSLGFARSMFLALRISMIRKGVWPLVGALFVLALIAVPLKAKVQLAVLGVSIGGFFLCFYVAAVSLRATSKVRDLFVQHLRLAAVDEKLGMLALVGDDVRALIGAWTKPAGTAADPTFPWKLLRFPMGVIIIIAVFWIIGLIGWSTRIDDSWIAQTISLLVPQALWEALRTEIFSERLLPPQAGEWVFFALWCALATAVLFLPWLVTSQRPNRVLMIVDDLDRCAPHEMLDVIEGLRLLVDDPALADRLQLLLLVDEDTLGHAIGLRYKTMVEERAGPDDEDGYKAKRAKARLDVIAEQNEKLFACHLRLSHLSDEDVASVVDGWRRKQGESPIKQQAAPDITQSTSRQPGQLKEYEVNDKGDGSPLRPAQVKPSVSGSELRFTHLELDLLRLFAPVYLRKTDRRASPRAVRLLLFKVQLCRLLLRQQYPDSPEFWSVEAVVQALEQSRSGAMTRDVQIARQII